MLLMFKVALSLATVAFAAPAPAPGFPPSLAPGCLPADANGPSLFCPGQDGYGCYKIPSLVATANGTLLAFAEARKFSCDDKGHVDLRVRRSFL